MWERTTRSGKARACLDALADYIIASAANRLRYTRRAVRANRSLAGDPE